jgi:hypothetical protein
VVVKAEALGSGQQHQSSGRGARTTAKPIYKLLTSPRHSTSSVSNSPLLPSHPFFLVISETEVN